MEITGWTLYWITRLDAVHMICTILMGFAIVAGMFLIAGALVIYTEKVMPRERESLRKLFKFWLLMLVLGLSGLFVPTTKQMVAFIVVPKVINNQQVQEIPQKLLDLGIDWLDEMKPEKAKE